MRKTVLLSSLSVGRCFTLEPAAGDQEEKPKSVRRSEPTLAPKDAWKITGEEGDQLVAESATGEKRTFAPDQKVAEIPRQGFDKLAARK